MYAKNKINNEKSKDQVRSKLYSGTNFTYLHVQSICLAIAYKHTHICFINIKVVLQIKPEFSNGDIIFSLKKYILGLFYIKYLIVLKMLYLCCIIGDPSY